MATAEEAAALRRRLRGLAAAGSADAEAFDRARPMLPAPTRFLSFGVEQFLYTNRYGPILIGDLPHEKDHGTAGGEDQRRRVADVL